MRRLGFLALALVLSAAAPALAVNPAAKLTRGIVNASTGWLEVPNQMAQRKDDGTVVMWTVHGLVHGLAIGLARTCYGFYDIITCPIGPYDAPMTDPDTLIAPKHGPRPKKPEGPTPAYDL